MGLLDLIEATDKIRLNEVELTIVDRLSIVISTQAYGDR